MAERARKNSQNKSRPSAPAKSGRGAASKNASGGKRSSGSGSARPAAERKRTETVLMEERRTNPLMQEAVLWLIIAVGIFFFISYFGFGGFFGSVISDICFGVFGWAAYLFPFLLILAAAFLVSNRGSRVAAVKFLSAVVLYLTVCGFFGLEKASEYGGLTISELYDRCAAYKTGGGAAGGGICSGLVPALGMVGAGVVLAILAIIALTLMTQKSFMRILHRQSRKMYHSAKENSERIRQDHEIERQIRKEEHEEERLRRREEYEQERAQRLEEARKRRIEREANADRAGSKPERHWTISTARLPEGEETNTGKRARQKRQDTSHTKRTEIEIPVIFPQTPEERRRSRRTSAAAAPSQSGTDELVSQERGQVRGGEVRQLVSKPSYAEMADHETTYIDLGEKGTGQEMMDPDRMPLHIEGISSDVLFKRSASWDTGAQNDQTDMQNQEAEPVSDDRAASEVSAADISETERAEQFHGQTYETEDTKLQTESSTGDMGWDEESGDPSYLKEEDQEQLPYPEAEPERRYDEIFAPENRLDSNSAGRTFRDRSGTDTTRKAEAHRAGAGRTIRTGMEEAGAQDGAAEKQETPQGTSARKNPRSSASEIEAGIADVEAEMAKAAEVVKKEYVFPPIDLLKRGAARSGVNQEQEVRQTAAKLQQTLDSFGVRAKVTNVSCGPSVTRYELMPEQGVKVKQIVALSDDIKLNLAATDIRIEAPIPGKSAVGIEVPNAENSTVMLRDLLETDEFSKHKSSIAFAVGKDIGGKTVVTDIAKMPHLLIAGATGSGKSVCINTLIMSILYKAKPEDVKLIMIDPKVVELSVYNGIPHLFIPVVTDPKKAAGALNWAVAEMTDRYNKFAEYGVRDLKGYNQRVDALPDTDDPNRPKKMPQIVIIVDELADLMMVAPGEVEDSICRLAQLARAAGIHLIIATQRPSVNVITGLIKANMPSRIAFSVSSGIDSRTIIDMYGAEKLLGKGDMLFYPQGYQKPARVQGAFVSDEEVSDVVDFLKDKNMSNGYSSEMEEQLAKVAQAGSSMRAAEDVDALFAEAGKFIIEKDKASIGMLQRVFKIGFNRAARIMDQLSDAGVVGPEEGTKPRKILMSLEEFDNYLEQN